MFDLSAVGPLPADDDSKVEEEESAMVIAVFWFLGACEFFDNRKIGHLKFQIGHYEFQNQTDFKV
jgi:hypothetical protein